MDDLFRAEVDEVKFLWEVLILEGQKVVEYFPATCRQLNNALSKTKTTFKIMYYA